MIPLPPDIYFASGLLVYGDPSAGGFVAKAFRISPPDLAGATDQYRDDVHDRLARLCSGLADTERIQWQWRVTPDYTDTLDAYDAVTDAAPKDDSVLATRRARSRCYRSKLHRRTLRREELVLYFAVKSTAGVPRFATKRRVAMHYDTLLAQQTANFQQIAQRLNTIFGETIEVAPLSDLDTFTQFYRFLNPSCDTKEGTDFAALFDPQLTAQDLCWNSDIHPFNGASFYLDGHYHSILSIKRLGRYTYTGIINALTALPFLNYQITVSIAPRDPEREQKIAQAKAETLENEQAVKFRRTRQVGIDKLDSQIQRLAADHAKPFDMLFVIRAWATEEALLASQIAAIRNAVQSMRGAETYQIALPASTASLFVATWPGNAFSGHSNRNIYIEDANLADLIPFSSSFVGLLDGAEALFEGAHNQLVGVRTFVNDTPQAAVVFGASRSGKSVTIQDILNQTAPMVGYTFIMEEGASHTEFTRKHGGRTLFLQPDAPYCINLFDTGGLPLTRGHVAFAVSMLAHMSGRVESMRETTARKALLNSYVQSVYDGYFEDWCNRNSALLPRIQREAYAVHLWHESNHEADVTLIDSTMAIRHGLASEDPTICEFVANLASDDILLFAKSPSTSQKVSNYGYCFFAPGDFPTLSAFAEFMTLHTSSDHPADVVAEISTNLRSWTADEGTYGGLFDGMTNVPLDGRVVHFELSRIPNDQTELKAAVALLIASRIRQHIYSLPRHVRKQVILEEMARYINIPDAANLVSELFAQMAKTGTWVCAVVQQYDHFKNSPVRATIMGNAKQFLIFRQQDPADLADIAATIGLPDDMRHAVSRYPIPADLPDDDRYSAFCYHVATRSPAITGTVYNRIPS